MADSHKKQLSRAVSQVDLAAALTSLPKGQEHGLRYTHVELLSLRPAIEKNGEHVEVTGIGSPRADGVMTPPNLAGPAPPPPTPASPGTATPDEDLKETTNNLTAPIEREQIKKKKRSSGKNRKAAPTGFEGSCFRSLLECPN
jgi:hypothetical protein